MTDGWLMILSGVISIISGLFSTLASEAAWRMSEGWKYKNVEPSEMNLLMYRLGGVFTMLIATMGSIIHYDREYGD